MLANNSRRTPIIPRGSLMPSNPSTMNSSGITEMISRSGATERTFAAEITLYTSTSVISLFSLDTAIIPWQGSIEIWLLGIPTITSLIWMFDFCSAWRTALRIDSTVSSISTMTPRLNPSDFSLPTPIIFNCPLTYSATTTFIEVVPISKLT